MSMGMVVVIVTVVLAVVMIVVIMVASMIVRFARGMGVAGMGAAFGIEGRFDLEDACAQPLHHCFDDMIAPDAQGLSSDLGR
jgi:hypothetical protein